MQYAALFAYVFLANVALAAFPHEPAVIWYGARLGVLPTTLAATAGTVAAAILDHRVFVPLITRATGRRGAVHNMTDPARMPGVAVLARFPFAAIALSGLTPLPFFPFKALAFTLRYPLGRYVAAVTVRCLPRYALLAWLGVAVRFPAWLLAAVFVLLMLPTMRLLWPRLAS